MSKKRNYKMQDGFISIPFKDIVELNLAQTVERIEYRARMGANSVYIRENDFENFILPRFEDANWEIGITNYGETERRIITQKLGLPKAEFILLPLKHGEIVVYNARGEEQYGIIGLRNGKLRLFHQPNRIYANPLGLYSTIARRATIEEIPPEKAREMQQWIQGDGLESVEVIARNPDQEFLRRMIAARAEQNVLPDGRIRFAVRMTHQAYRILHARCTGYRRGRIYGRKIRAEKIYEGTYQIRREHINN